MLFQDSSAGDPPRLTPVLPPATVTWLFERLGVRYGHFFLGRWSGISLEEVKKDWAFTLRDLSNDQLLYGIEHLPERDPPDAAMFRRLCREMPDAQGPVQLPPKSGPVQVPAPVLELVIDLQKPHPDAQLPNGVAWARRYAAIWSGNKHLSLVQKQMLTHAQKVLANRDPTVQKPDGGEEI